MAELDAKLEQLPNAAVVRIVGELRLVVDPLQRLFDRLTTLKPKVVILDLTGLNFISSLGMGTLISFRRGIVATGGVVKIACPQPIIRDCLNRVRLNELFQMCDTMEAAMPAT